MQEINISIHRSKPTDFLHIMKIERSAFGQEEEAKLVAELLNDESALPYLSLLAWVEGIPVGHILFTKASIADAKENHKLSLLAPLAITPTFQGKGIGGKLIRKGLEILNEEGIHYVFVLGHSSFYAKYGFIPDALSHGFAPPFPIPRIHKDAWMYVELNKPEHALKKEEIIQCANAINKQHYWVE